ncbi:MAG: efflux RND transporter periplasmic adaptor subunit [Isosphaeraceae bacterium]
MTDQATHYRNRRGRIALLLGVGLALLGGAFMMSRMFTRAGENVLRTVTVRPVDFDSVIVAPGSFISIRSTEIRCGVERVSGAGESTILQLVDDGVTVKKGELLCQLDASAFEELVRRQTITVDQARASHRQAELNLEAARIQLEVYEQGEMVQTDRSFQGQLALARSDLTRQEDRLKWTERMLEKGYLPLLQVSTEQQTLRRAELTLAQTERSFSNFQRFTVPMAVRSRQSAVNGASATLEFENIKLKREEERLALYRKMVENCSITAPHDGLVIHANRSGRSPEVYLGATVRQRQRLFTLPDLSEMEVEVMLHETMVNRVKPGQPARVWAEAFPDRTIPGVVTSVAPLPYNERRRESGSEVTFFQARVRLESTPRGLRPGMSARIEIRLEGRDGVLAIPTQAVVSADGKDGCRVLVADRVEFRPLTLGVSSHDRIEVLEGLHAGERVVLPQ